MRAPLLLIAAFSLISCGQASTDVQPPPDRCGATHQWIAEHRGAVVSYDDLILFPVECRRFIYGEQTAAAQSALWRTQYERYRAAHPSLSEEQQSVLSLAVELASPDVIPTGPDGPWRQALIDFESRALQAFGREETGRLFAQLGPSNP